MMAIRTMAATAAIAVASASGPAAEEVPFRISLNTGPNHVRNIALEDFVNRLAERTEGRLDVQVFPSGQLFKGPDVPKALAQGSIEMGVPIILYISRVVPNAGLLDLPAFYGRTPEEIHAVMDGEIGAELNAEIEAKMNVRVLGRNLDLGHGSIFTTDHELNSLADLDGLTLRVPGSPAARARYDSLGVDSVAISFADVPIALTQKSIDGLMTTHETIRSAKLWESGLKYAIDTKGTFFQYVPMIGNSTWDSFDSDLQQIISDTWSDTVDGARALAADRQASARLEAIENGITAVSATAEELVVSEAFVDQEATRMDPDFVARAAAALEM